MPLISRFRQFPFPQAPNWNLRDHSWTGVVPNMLRRLEHTELVTGAQAASLPLVSSCFNKKDRWMVILAPHICTISMQHFERLFAAFDLTRWPLDSSIDMIGKVSGVKLIGLGNLSPWFSQWYSHKRTLWYTQWGRWRSSSFVQYFGEVFILFFLIKSCSQRKTYIHSIQTRNNTYQHTTYKYEYHKNVMQKKEREPYDRHGPISLRIIGYRKRVANELGNS